MLTVKYSLQETILIQNNIRSDKKCNEIDYLERVIVYPVLLYKLTGTD